MNGFLSTQFLLLLVFPSLEHQFFSSPSIDHIHYYHHFSCHFFCATLPTLIFTLFFAVSHKMPPVKRCWSVVNLTSLTRPREGTFLSTKFVPVAIDIFFVARTASHLGCSFVFIWPRPPVANLVDRTGGYVSVFWSSFSRVIFLLWFRALNLGFFCTRVQIMSFRTEWCCKSMDTID